MEAYQDLVLNKLTRMKRVADMRSSFVLRELVNKTQLPLGHLQ
jgi:Lrp/AsnC family leucine-responsive transcriptional regulator